VTETTLRSWMERAEESRRHPVIPGSCGDLLETRQRHRDHHRSRRRDM